MGILGFISGVLGGGVAVAIIDWIRTNNAERRRNKIQTLITQIERLYGPLYFFSSQNNIFFNLNKDFHDAYNLEYIGKSWSQEKGTQTILNEETDKTLDIANSYLDLVLENNNNILGVLRENFAYIDSDDIVVFSEFITDYIRMKNETSDERKLETPHRIYSHIGKGNISFMRSEFIDHVEKQFKLKQNELKMLVERGKKNNIFGGIIKMNKYQRIVAILYMVILTGMLLFPPFRMIHQGISLFRGFRFIFSPPSAYLGIDMFQLFVQFVFVTLIFGVGWFLFKDK